MTALVASALAALAPLAAALFASRAPTPTAARRAGTIGMGLALVAGVLAAASSAPRWDALLPAFVSAIGLGAVAMSAVGNATRTRLARILLVHGASAALVLSDHPIGLALGWAASVVPTWLELREHPATRPAARSFLAYNAPSAALVASGAALLALGLAPALAVVPLSLGLAIRAAMVPLHSWLPSFVERAPMGLVVAFVAPQIGVYAHLRWLTPGLPPELEQAVAALGAVTVVFAAALGVVQRRARRALGYFLVSQTALVAFGLEARSEVGRSGAILAWLVAGLATAGFALTTAALEARRGPLSLERPSGGFRQIPTLASAYLVLGLASVGLPGTLGFVAEDLLLQGALEQHPFLGLTLILGTTLNGVTIVRGFFRLFTGSRPRGAERDLVPRERVVLTVLLGALIVAGLWPAGPLAWRGPRPDHVDEQGSP